MVTKSVCVPFPVFCLAIISGPNAQDSVEESDVLVDIAPR